MVVGKYHLFVLQTKFTGGFGKQCETEPSIYSNDRSFARIWGVLRKTGVDLKIFFKYFV